MPKFGQLNEGKYLKKDDFPAPALLTIREWKRENVARENDPDEFKWVLYFSERIGDSNNRGLIVNPTNEQLIQLATGCSGTEDSIGKKVVLFNEPTVSMGGKLTGGIRIRAPKNQPVQSAPAAPEPGPNDPDDVGF